ncbi:MAG TPA: tripartite tricarboxylate transporter permease, partial [Pseudolabrys sp.]|nr:tripartite tricarboxylate transporter permease [Pseudolabrys sp.]
MIETALADLWSGFGVALEPHNLMWCFVGVLVGNMVGVLPGMGPLATISILLPLTFGIKPVGAILMLAGILYGAQYGGAICSILLNLPCHPPHAVTCLDGFPMTKQGKGGVALGLSVMGSFIGASWGITEMIFLAPVLVKLALEFGPAEICSLMLLGLLAGSTLARGSPIKGVAMTVFGLLLGIVGTDVESGTYRLTFGMAHLYDGIELVALALGIFGIAEFMNSVNQVMPVNMAYSKVRLRDMRPTKAEVKTALPAMFRGTLVGSLCSLIPGTGPTIASFIAYATEKKLSKTPEKFGTGMIQGVVSPETATHSSIQGDFIPTMSLGIPGDAVMALLLGALMIQGIVPGPQLISEHPDIFWGLVASFWIGNILLVLLNVPLIGIWVKLLAIPYKYLYPSALFFVCIGVYASNND